MAFLIFRNFFEISEKQPKQRGWRFLRLLAVVKICKIKNFANFGRKALLRLFLDNRQKIFDFDDWDTYGDHFRLRRKFLVTVSNHKIWRFFKNRQILLPSTVFEKSKDFSKTAWGKGFDPRWRAPEGAPGRSDWWGPLHFAAQAKRLRAFAFAQNATGLFLSSNCPGKALFNPKNRAFKKGPIFGGKKSP